MVGNLNFGVLTIGLANSITRDFSMDWVVVRMR